MAPEEQRHRPALDGLRGLAILLVMLFHFSWTFAETPPVSRAIKYALWAGWTGVDLFFVLSGFLITRGLVATSSRPMGARLKNFWIRRSLRIFPLYFIALVVGSIACAQVGARVPELPYWLYVQNYALAFDPDPERWTSHLWSLAVEEQFYFLWPLAVLAAGRKRVAKLVPAVVGLCVLAAVLRVGLTFGVHDLHGQGASPDTSPLLGVLRAARSASLEPLTRVKLAYRALPTRMDPLLWGALLALFEATPEAPLARLWREKRPLVIAAASAVVLGVVAWTRGFAFYDRRVVVLGYGSVALLFAGCVSFAADTSIEHPVLAWGPLRELGRVSYGMYVIHWPLVSLGIPFFKKVQEWTSDVRALEFGVGATATGVLVTYGLAWLSYRYVEGPFLRAKPRFGDG